MNRRNTPLSNRNTDAWGAAGHSLECSTSHRLTSPVVTFRSFKQTQICMAGVQFATRCALLQEASETSLNLSDRRLQNRSELRPDLSACGILLCHVTSRLCHQYALSNAYLDTVRAIPTLPSIQLGQTSQTANYTAITSGPLCST